jgi:hypothetical protein
VKHEQNLPEVTVGIPFGHGLVIGECDDTSIDGTF